MKKKLKIIKKLNRLILFLNLKYTKENEKFQI